MTLDDLMVHPIRSHKARQWMYRNHYTKGCHNGPSPNYGLFKKGSYEMVGAMAFCPPVSENVRAQVFGEQYADRVIELHRLHTLDACPKNASSFFVARAVRMLLQDRPQTRAIISFSDTTEGHDGTTYKALNFHRCGQVKQGHTFKDESGRMRSARQCGVNITKADAIAKGWQVIERKPKNRFILIVAPDKREKRQWTKRFNEVFAS